MLSTRIATALVLIPLVLGALFALPPLGWAVVALAAIAAAAIEWARLAGCDRTRERGRSARSPWPAARCCSWCRPRGSARAAGHAGMLLALCGPALAVLARSWRRVAAHERAAGVAVRACAIGLIVLIGAWAAVVQLQSRSPWLVLAALAIVWVADTAAYFAGRALGRRKLAPAISPGKTWEGVYGGLAAVAIYALALVPLAPRAGYSGDVDRRARPAPGSRLRSAITVLSVEGDLVESLLKRHAGVKDSGRLLPGHGGVLDRIDALLSSMPAAALARGSVPA